MSFHSCQNKNPLQPQIRFNNININSLCEIKFVGIHLMESLKWEAHIRVLCSSLNKRLYMLQSLKYSTSSKLWRNMYFAHFHSHIRYVSIFGGNSGESQTVLNCKKRQKNVSRNIFCREWFKRWNILTVRCVYITETICYVKENLEKFNQNSNNHNPLSSLRVLIDRRGCDLNVGLR